jgi:hypothetical protein
MAALQPDAAARRAAGDRLYAKLLRPPPPDEHRDEAGAAAAPAAPAEPRPYPTPAAAHDPDGAS